MRNRSCSTHSWRVHCSEQFQLACAQCKASCYSDCVILFEAAGAIRSLSSLKLFASWYYYTHRVLVDSATSRHLFLTITIVMSSLFSTNVLAPCVKKIKMFVRYFVYEKFVGRTNQSTADEQGLINFHHQEILFLNRAIICTAEFSSFANKKDVFLLTDEDYCYRHAFAARYIHHC